MNKIDIEILADRWEETQQYEEEYRNWLKSQETK